MSYMYILLPSGIVVLIVWQSFNFTSRHLAPACHALSQYREAVCHFLKLFHQVFQNYLSQTFTRYLNYKKDNNELLLYILRQLIGDQAKYQRNRFGDLSEEFIQIKEKELTEKVSAPAIRKHSCTVIHENYWSCQCLGFYYKAFFPNGQ